MTDGYLNFDEYIRQGEPAQQERAEAWRVAIGLQTLFFPIDNTTLLPLRGEFGGHSPMSRYTPAYRPFRAFAVDAPRRGNELPAQRQRLGI